MCALLLQIPDVGVCVNILVVSLLFGYLSYSLLVVKLLSIRDMVSKESSLESSFVMEISLPRHPLTTDEGHFPSIFGWEMDAKGRPRPRIANLASQVNFVFVDCFLSDQCVTTCRHVNDEVQCLRRLKTVVF